MSEKNFQDAKSALALSQSLRDGMEQQKIMSEQEPQEPQISQEPQQGPEPKVDIEL